MSTEQERQVCWICQCRPADTREHKFKASDLRRFFGPSRWLGEATTIHGSEDGDRQIQGPRSPRLTFGRVLCPRCNNQGTQDADLAYERFVEWLLANRERVLRDRSIDLTQVYGREHEASQLDLLRYFAKHLGCNVARAEGHGVPDGLRQIVSGATHEPRLRVTFHVHDDTLLGPGLDEGLWLGGLGHFRRDGVDSYWTHIGVGWLWIFLWYEIEPPAEDATHWFANASVIRLGGHAPLSDGMRREVVEKAAGATTPTKDPS